MYEKIKAWYELGVWNEERVRNAVIKGKITADEYTQITGKAY